MLMRAPHAVGVRNLNIVLGEGEGGDDHDEEEDENEYENNVDDKHKSVHWEMKTNMRIQMETNMKIQRRVIILTNRMKQMNNNTNMRMRIWA